MTPTNIIPFPTRHSPPLLFDKPIPRPNPAPPAADPYQPGAILSSSWGYDQTNYDFYRITKRKGDWVTFIPLEAIHTPKEDPNGVPGHSMRTTVLPGGEMPRGGRILGWNLNQGYDGRPRRRKLCHRDGRAIGFSVVHGWCSVWDGQPEHATHYA